tara:strand:- start:669 stop:944 length:276 start_codon:yes stop_codon:yes gene_type:complete
MKEENSLDEKTCKTVMKDLSGCIDNWSGKDLDPESTIKTLLKFSVDVVFEFSHSSYDAMDLMSEVIFEKLEQNDDQDMLMNLNESKNKIVH